MVIPLRSTTLLIAINSLGSILSLNFVFRSIQVASQFLPNCKLMSDN